MAQALRIALALVGGFMLGWLIFSVLHFRLLMPELLVPVCIGLVWWLLPRFVPSFKPASTQSGRPLSMTTEAEWTVIAARPSPLPKRGSVLAVLIPSPLAIFGALTGNLGAGLMAWMVGSGLILAWIHHGNRTKRHAMREPFAVKRDAIRLPGGEVIPRKRIHRFGIRNTEAGQVLFYGGNSAQRRGQIGRALTHARMVPISNAVVVEHDGTLSYLAGGLTEELANAVLHEIGNHVDGFAMHNG